MSSCCLNCTIYASGVDCSVSLIICTDIHGRWKHLKVGGASSVRGHGERMEREPITGVWGQSPQRGPGTEPLVGSQAVSYTHLTLPTNREV